MNKRRSLSRAVVLGVLTLLPLAGCSTLVGDHGYGMRPEYVIELDQDIAQSLWRRISSDESLERAHINVDVYNTRVLLTGQVPSDSAKQRAETLAQQTDGVRLVRNELAVRPATSTQRRLHDTWITSKIKTRLIASEHIDADRVRITTENGVVYLMGLVRNSEANRVVSIVSQVDGVQRIVKAFEYLD